MKISSISKLLAGSSYEDKAVAIEKAFKMAGVETLDDLDNAPRLLGSDVAGYSVYGLCSYLREAAIQHEIQKSAPIFAPEPVVEVPVPEEDIEVEILEDISEEDLSEEE